MMQKVFLRYLISTMFILLMFTACDNSSKIKSLSQDVDSLKNQYSRLKSELNDLKVDSNIEKMLKDTDKIAYLKPSDEGYALVNFDLGILTVSIENVRPYANGSKVTLRFGNTLSSTINGLKAKVEYGPVDENGATIYSERKYKDLMFSKSLRPGSWTKLDFVLDGVLPERLGYVIIKDITHTGIMLLN